MGQVHSYNDADGMVGHGDEFEEAYMRGAYIWKDAAHSLPRDCQKFYLREGIADEWDTFEVNLDRMEAMGKPVGFRLIDAGHVPAGYDVFESNGRAYPDFRKWNTRELYRADFELDFALRFGRRLSWIDIPYPFCPSNEPGVAWQTLKDLGDGNEAVGKENYMNAAKWMIDLYTVLFRKKCIGNLGGPSWAAKILLPYALSNGVDGFRQDSGGRFDWLDNDRVEGENRASMYDERIGYLGGRDKFSRLIIEITGNGIRANGNDQGSGQPYPVADMIGPGGEIEQLEVTDFGNMGLPFDVAFADTTSALLDSFYGVASVPGDGGTVPPVEPDPPDPQFVTHEEFAAYMAEQMVIDLNLANRIDALEAWAERNNFNYQ